MRDTYWNIETNDQHKVAGPYATKEAAIDGRWYFPAIPKLYVVEYETKERPPASSVK